MMLFCFTFLLCVLGMKNRPLSAISEPGQSWNSDTQEGMHRIITEEGITAGGTSSADIALAQPQQPQDIVQEQQPGQQSQQQVQKGWHTHARHRTARALGIPTGCKYTCSQALRMAKLGLQQQDLALMAKMYIILQRGYLIFRRVPIGEGLLLAGARDSYNNGLSQRGHLQSLLGTCLAVGPHLRNAINYHTMRSKLEQAINDQLHIIQQDGIIDPQTTNVAQLRNIANHMDLYEGLKEWLRPIYSDVDDEVEYKDKDNHDCKQSFIQYLETLGDELQ